MKQSTFLPKNKKRIIKYHSVDKNHKNKNMVKTIYLYKFFDQTFQRKLREENECHKFLPGDVIPQIFSNITSIYQFHKDFLLPQLQNRMTDW